MSFNLAGATAKHVVYTPLVPATTPRDVSCKLLSVRPFVAVGLAWFFFTVEYHTVGVSHYFITSNYL